MAAEGVELREISGDHLSLLKEPQVRLLAQELADCLARSVSEGSLVAAGAQGIQPELNPVYIGR